MKSDTYTICFSFQVNPTREGGPRFAVNATKEVRINVYFIKYMKYVPNEILKPDDDVTFII